MKYLIFDMSNILYKAFYVHPNEDDKTIAGIASHTALMMLNKYYKNFKPHKIVMCFDRSNWRKEYTQTDDCVSGKIYKGQRRKNQTDAQKARYLLFLDHMGEFEEMMAEHTSIINLASDGLEADDLMASVVQTVGITDPNAEFIVVSADKDLIQLLGYPNTRLIDPTTGKDRTLEEWNGDAELFLFEKFIRGDTGDNVQSSLPRCRKTRIVKAYTDEYERANLMMETWKDQNGKEFKVKDLFEENQLLMDLREQPDDVQINMVKTVLGGMENPGKYSYFHFMKFLGKYDMRKVAETVEQFVPMLSR